MGGMNFNSDPLFRMQAQDLGSVGYFPDDHLTPSPDARGDAPVDLDHWEDHTPAHDEESVAAREAIFRGLGSPSIKEARKQAAERHPSARRPKPHLF